MSSSHTESRWSRAFHGLPAPIIAAGLIRGCRQMMAENPDRAWNVICNLWQEVSPHLALSVMRDPSGGMAIGALVLEAYFGKKGDWRAMEDGLSNRMAGKGGIPRALIDLVAMQIADMLTDAAAHKSDEPKVQP
jgi:hypothetical protein